MGSRRAWSLALGLAAAWGCEQASDDSGGTSAANSGGAAGGASGGRASGGSVAGGASGGIDSMAGAVEPGGAGQAASSGAGTETGGAGTGGTSAAQGGADPGVEGGASGASTMGGEGAAGTGAGGTGGDGGSGLGFDPPRCGDGSVNPTRTCEGLEDVVLLDPRVVTRGPGGAGRGVAPGDSANVSVSIFVDGGEDWLCVGILADHPDVTVASTEEAWLGMNPQGFAPFVNSLLNDAWALVADFSPSIPAGTSVRFTAWTTRQNTDCVGNHISFDVTVEEEP